MPSNNTHWAVHYLQGKYGHIGHLYSPGAGAGPYYHIPYALDNGAFAAWTNGKEWDRNAFVAHVDKYAFGRFHPRWVVVPDVVGDKCATLDMWGEWSGKMRRTDPHVHLAFAVQDGMDIGDVPDADVVFVGGTTDWKWATMESWCAAFPRVHVARVNGYESAMKCARAGAESIDGTGWFRSPHQVRDLCRLVAQLSGKDYDAGFAASLELCKGQRVLLDV